MKKEISLLRANRLINSGQVVLVSCGYEKKKNIITLAWDMPVSHKPPLCVVSISTNHFSSELIKKSGEFVINVPSLQLLDKVVYCGSHSGRDVDKFKEVQLSAVKANKLKTAPLISECIGHLECILKEEKETGDHILFIGEVIFASAEEKFFSEFWDVNKVKLIYHLGGRVFTSSDKIIEI